MEKKQWVQHISGMGEKWSVCDAGSDDQRWQTVSQSGRLTMFLPKSEYRLCAPPEVWRDVTGDCLLVPEQDDIVHNGAVVTRDRGYRLRKIKAETQHKCGVTLASIIDVFIVEKKR